MNVVDHGDTQLAYSNAYDLTGHTGEPTYALFGGWQTTETLGYVAVTQNDEGHTEIQISTEERGDREIATELKDRIGQVIERSQTQHATPTGEPPPTNHANTHDPSPDREHQAEPTVEPQPAQPTIEPDTHQSTHNQQNHQQDVEHSIEPDNDNDLQNDHGYGIE
ncbi:MAG: hypothetical protein WB709_07415 [Solirubrobacteraceae bacterium]